MVSSSMTVISVMESPITSCNELNVINTPKLQVRHPCAKCGKLFAKYHNLKVHWNLHQALLNFSCKYCGGKFSNAANLRNHELSHFGEKKFKCNDCSKLFYRKSALKRHILNHYIDLRRFMCTECDHRAINETELKYHKRLHSEPLFQCSQCSSAFYCKSDLEKHGKVHSGLKNFTCDICLDSFSRHENLKRHLSVHSFDNFKCLTCGAPYVQKMAFSKHIAKHKKPVERRLYLKFSF